MKKYVVVVAALPVRKIADHKSELVNQMLFGEELEMLEHVNSWVYIKSVLDQYEGWVELRPEYFEAAHSNTKTTILCSGFGRIVDAEKSLIIPIGSILGNSNFHLEDGNEQPVIDCIDSLKIIEKVFLGSPYLWGGKTPMGIDCSGLVQIYARLLGITLPRDTKDQAKQGDDVLLDQYQTGDLVFFDGKFGESVNHVGIICESGKILHASGSVRIDSFNQEGIWNIELKKMTHKYLFAKRIKSPL